MNNHLRAYPLLRPTYTPDRSDRREITPRNIAYRAFVDRIKACRTQAEYPAELLERRRSSFIDSIQIGKVTVK